VKPKRPEPKTVKALVSKNKDDDDHLGSLAEQISSNLLSQLDGLFQ